MIEYDNRHLWMKLKTIKGSHFANYREAWDANQLVCEGKVLPPLSAVYPLEEVGDAAYQVHQNLHEGKIGVLCLAPSEGLGIEDPELARAGRRGPDHPVPEARRVTAPLLTEIDHVAIAVAGPRSGDRLLRRTCSGHRSSIVSGSRSDGVEEALIRVADSYIQLLTPVRPDSPVAEVPREERGGPPPRRVPGRRLRRWRSSR